MPTSTQQYHADHIPLTGEVEVTEATSTASSDEAEPDEGGHDEELRFRLAADQRLADQMRINSLSMVARLPRMVRRALDLARGIDPRATLALLICQVLSGLLQVGGLLATTGTITAMIGSGHISARLWQALPSVVVLAGTAGLRALLGIAVSALSSRLSPKVSRAAEQMLVEAGMDAEAAAYFHPGYNDRWDAADRGAQLIEQLLSTAQNMTASLASLLASLVVVTFLNPLLLPLLLLASLPQGIAGAKGATLQYLASLETASEYRAVAMLRWYMLDKQVADLVRSNTMSGFLMARYQAAGRKVDEKNDEAVALSARYGVLGALCGGLASCLVWGCLGLLLVTGHISIPAAGTAVFALRNASSSLQGIVGYGASIFRYTMYMEDWSDFLKEAGGFRLNRGTVVPNRPNTIRTKNITFTYPESTRPALDCVDVEVREGEIIALIGENGSGKTTLGKMLTGLLVPDSGKVMWDGIDTRDLDPHALWKHTAMVPQNWIGWPLTAREVITFGQPHGGDDAVMRAAAISGADDVIAELRNGLETLLARSWWGGQELSGGQWQRLSIASAFHRPAGLLVMDEPTSALDARGEHRVFTGLRELARDRAVVLVTHRLQNVSVADRIYVMEHGRVIQCGSYQQLVQQGHGVFFDLWQLQRDREEHQ